MYMQSFFWYCVRERDQSPAAGWHYLDEWHGRCGTDRRSPHFIMAGKKKCVRVRVRVCDAYFLWSQTLFGLASETSKQLYF